VSQIIHLGTEMSGNPKPSALFTAAAGEVAECIGQRQQNFKTRMPTRRPFSLHPISSRPAPLPSIPRATSALGRFGRPPRGTRDTHTCHCLNRSLGAAYPVDGDGGACGPGGGPGWGRLDSPPPGPGNAPRPPPVAHNQPSCSCEGRRASGFANGAGTAGGDRVWSELNTNTSDPPDPTWTLFGGGWSQSRDSCGVVVT